jgi:hypothetical protein
MGPRGAAEGARPVNAAFFFYVSSFHFNSGMEV